MAAHHKNQIVVEFAHFLVLVITQDQPLPSGFEHHELT